MDLRNLAANRVQCAELLENRRLLSGFAPAPEASPAVEVVELVAAEQEEEDDVLVEPSDIPATVMSAFDAAYPDAQILEAELEEEEDGQFEYDIAARFNEGEIEVSLTPEGRITETTRILTKTELPPAVLDWLAANFAGAEVHEIELVDEGGVQSYELQIAPPDGAPMEATLRVPAALPDATSDEPPRAARSSEAVPAGAAGDEARSDEAEAVATAPARQSAPEQEEVSLPLVDAKLVDSNPSAEPAREAAPESLTAGVFDSPADPLADAAALLAADAAGLLLALNQSGRLLPDVASMMGQPFPFNAADFQRDMQQILAQIERLGASLAGPGTGSVDALRLALLAALIAGAQLLRPDPRAAKNGQVLAGYAVDRSSTWVLWASITNRR